MKLRIKYSNTKKFVVNIEEPNLGALKEAVSAYISSNYGTEIGDVCLSFNGKETIGGDHSSSLSELGIVNGDLLFIIQPPSPELSNESNTTSSMTHNASAQSSVCDNSDGKLKRNNGFSSNQKILNLLDAVDGIPPKSVFDCFDQYSPSSESEVLNLLIHITMLEAGFALGESPSDRKYLLPFSWKEMASTLKYHNPGFQDFVCTIVIVSMGNIKQVLASFEGQESEISVKLNTKEYFASKEILPCNLIKLSQLSRLLRTNLLYPLQVAAHLTLGLPAPWHLSGLPQEILVHILSHLNLLSVLRVAVTCKRLNKASEDNKLWYDLFKRDFKDQYHPSDTISGADWRAKYKAAYIKKKQREGKKNKDILEEPVPIPLYPEIPHPFNPFMPQPIGPNPYYPPQPDPQPNPFWDPDSPYFGGEIPPAPGPFLPNPFIPFGNIRPTRPNPLRPPFMPPQPRNPRGPRFDFI